jgi:hypothetical protein
MYIPSLRMKSQLEFVEILTRLAMARTKTMHDLPVKSKLEFLTRPAAQKKQYSLLVALTLLLLTTLLSKLGGVPRKLPRALNPGSQRL